MTLKAALVVITYLLIRSCVISLEFTANYQPQIPENTFLGSFMPLNPHRQSAPQFFNNTWDVYTNMFEAPPMSKPHRNIAFQNLRRSFESSFKNHIKPAPETLKNVFQTLPTVQETAQDVANDFNRSPSRSFKVVNKDINRSLQDNRDSYGIFIQDHPSYIYYDNFTPDMNPDVFISNKMEYRKMDTLKMAHPTRIENIARKTYVIRKFIHALDHLERTFYATTYTKLSSISSPERQMNGISFALSSLFLQIALIALSTEVDPETRTEIDRCTGFNVSEQDFDIQNPAQHCNCASHLDTLDDISLSSPKINYCLAAGRRGGTNLDSILCNGAYHQDKVTTLKDVLSWLPVTNNGLKFRFSSRLVLRSGLQVSRRFRNGAGLALRMNITYLDAPETPEVITRTLNHMVAIDSGGSMHDTFDEEELSDGVCAVLLSSVYVRARWRAPPTLLNGTLPFRDSEAASDRTTHMIRINDIMRYVDLQEWDAEALEINYATPGLTFFLVVPRGTSLRNVAAHMSVTSVESISYRMQRLRVAATLPLYTLRMTLLLPAKLQAMGINRLIDANNTCDSLKLSHAVQRIMFWSEAGRYAFKDDGIEWDETPELKIIVDRPYLFYVRWHNITILNGNFVL